MLLTTPLLTLTAAKPNSPRRLGCCMFQHPCQQVSKGKGDRAAKHNPLLCCVSMHKTLLQLNSGRRSLRCPFGVPPLECRCQVNTQSAHTAPPHAICTSTCHGTTSTVPSLLFYMACTASTVVKTTTTQLLCAAHKFAIEATSSDLIHACRCTRLSTITAEKETCRVESTKGRHPQADNNPAA